MTDMPEPSEVTEAYEAGYKAAVHDAKTQNCYGSDFGSTSEILVKAWEDGYYAALDDLNTP